MRATRHGALGLQQAGRRTFPRKPRRLRSGCAREHCKAPTDLRKPRSNHVGRRLDARVAQIDFGLPTMMSNLNVHREQNLTPRKMPVWTIVRLGKLLPG